MNGLIAKSIEHFLIFQHGQEVWKAAAKQARVPDWGFEAVQDYPPEMLTSLMAHVSTTLDRPNAELWEDLGTHLVTHPDMEIARRLLRFGGPTFEAFLWSLDALHPRAALAVPGLDIPELSLRRVGPSRYALWVAWEGFGPEGCVIAGALTLGVLRAIADDFGALVFLDAPNGLSQINITLIDADFAEGRDFSLSGECSAPKPSDPFSANTPNTTPLTLRRSTLDAVLPFNLVIDPNLNVTHVGRTLRKMTGPFERRHLPEVMQIDRPVSEITPAALRELSGKLLNVTLDTGKADPIDLKATFEAIGEEGWLCSLHLGPSLLTQIAAHSLTARDFAPCDPIIDMLFLLEANGTALTHATRLNEKLDAARTHAEIQASTDKLTGLYNRRAMDQIMQSLAENKAPRFGLMHLDLDYFKSVNDTLGHAAGDHVLVEVAKILREEVRRGDPVGRVGGDEFLLLFPDCLDTDILGQIAHRIIARLEEPIPFNGALCRISASIGTTLSSLYQRVDLSVMQADADHALYAAKEAGRAQHRFHTPVEQAARASPSVEL